MYVRSNRSSEKIGEDVKAAWRDIKKKGSHPTSDSASGGRALSSLPESLREVPDRFDRGHLFPFAAEEEMECDEGGVEAGEWDRSPDAYSAGKRKKVRTTTNMASSSPRGVGERTSRRDGDVSWVLYPAQNIHLTGAQRGNRTMANSNRGGVF